MEANENKKNKGREKTQHHKIIFLDQILYYYPKMSSHEKFSKAKHLDIPKLCIAYKTNQLILGQKL